MTPAREIGLTPFITGMMRTQIDALRSADVDRLAAKYAIPVDWARWYIAMWVDATKR